MRSVYSNYTSLSSSIHNQCRTVGIWKNDILARYITGLNFHFWRSCSWLIISDEALVIFDIEGPGRILHPPLSYTILPPLFTDLILDPNFPPPNILPPNFPPPNILPLNFPPPNFLLRLWERKKIGTSIPAKYKQLNSLYVNIFQKINNSQFTNVIQLINS